MSLLIERRELLDRFKRGERRALEEVYRHYAPEVAAFLQRGFTFSSAGRPLHFRGYAQPFDLDNALQETFVRAFKESARLAYDGLHPYKSYLLAIARNLVLDEFRNREVAMSPFIEQLDGGGGGETIDGAVAEGESAAPASTTSDARSAGVSAEQEFLRNELGRLYAAFVARLQERDRTFFRHRFEEQQTQVEAGTACGLTHMQARTLEKKLRRAFLEFMQSNGYLEAYAGAATAVKAT
ncbi:MAG: sigma-70 family RNA polymerase sigma factor [Myxococcales bacterium]|nr:sigma-70 family RNA polymerase sigma factor [Myxococcales bacterium]